MGVWGVGWESVGEGVGGGIDGWVDGLDWIWFVVGMA